MSSVSFRSSAAANNGIGTGGSLTITKPAGLVVGDMMFVHLIGQDAGAGNSLTYTSSGFTQLFTSGNLSGSNINYNILWKVAVAADVAAASFVFVPSTSNVNVWSYGRLSAWTNPDNLFPINVSNVGTGLSTASATSSGITPTVSPILLLMFAGGSNDSAIRTVASYAVVTTNPTWTEHYDAGVIPASTSEKITLAVATGFRTALTATGNATATFSGSQETYQLAIIALAQQVNRPTSIVLPLTVPNVIIPFVVQTFFALLTVVEPVIVIVANKWSNTQKNVSTWLNPPKS